MLHPYVDSHAHTVASAHAYSTVHDYWAIAKQKGLSLFAITDHGPAIPDSPHLWHFGNMKVLPRLHDGIGLIRGVEANILNAQGDIDIPPKTFPFLDMVMAGLHEPAWAPSTIAAHTDALIGVMAQGQVDIISHPGNPNYPIDITAVAQAAAHYQVALELNNSSFTLSRPGSAPQCLAIAEAVGLAGGYLAFGSDSHVAFTLGEVTHCVAVAQQVGFPQERIIAQSPKAFLAFLAQRGHEPIPEFAHFLVE